MPTGTKIFPELIGETLSIRKFHMTISSTVDSLCDEEASSTAFVYIDA